MSGGRRLKPIALTIFALIWLGLPLWNALLPHRPVLALRTLDGCYRGEGLPVPDFIGAAPHWAFRIADGRMIDRSNHEISRVRLVGSGPRQTSVAFSPAILVTGKPADLMVGDMATGKAYIWGKVPTLTLANEKWFQRPCD